MYKMKSTFLDIISYVLIKVFQLKNIINYSRPQHIKYASKLENELYTTCMWKVYTQMDRLYGQQGDVNLQFRWAKKKRERGSTQLYSA